MEQSRLALDVEETCLYQAYRRCTHLHAVMTFSEALVCEPVRRGLNVIASRLQGEQYENENISGE